jgi:hypothetical protein
VIGKLEGLENGEGPQSLGQLGMVGPKSGRKVGGFWGGSQEWWESNGHVGVVDS